MHPGPEGSLRHDARMGMRCLPTHRFDSLGSNVVQPGGVMVGGPSSEIAHAPRVIIADLVSVAVVDVHHVFDALLAAAHGHFPSQREASAQGVETRLGYVGRVLGGSDKGG